MATPSQINKQFLLEQEAISCGKQKLRDSIEKLESKSYSSASVYGVPSITAALPILISYVEDHFWRLTKGQAGKYYKPIADSIIDLEPLAIATIILKITFDNVFSTRQDADRVLDVILNIGAALESECKFRWYKAEHPGLMKYISDTYFHDACGTKQKEAIASKKFGDKGIRWHRWPTKSRLCLGRWGLEAVIKTTGWFTIEKKTINRKRKESKVAPSEKFMAQKEELIKNAELFSGIPWPMLVEPNDWAYKDGKPIYGGYVINRLMKGHDLTRKSNHPIIHGTVPMAFLNKLQKVSYRVNTHVLGVAEELKERGIIVGKFIPISSAFHPPRPPDADEDKEKNHAWKRAKAEAHNADRINFRRSVRTRTQLEAAQKFRDDKFWIPWSFDYRGRAYPIPAFLTPQDTDFGKSLLVFADEQPVGKDGGTVSTWLAFQVATTFGLDKATIIERIQWVDNNRELITRVATDPLSNLPDWENVDEPWQFMASCHEYYHCCIVCDKNTTGLMVAVDATCSGLQILAGLAKDASTASLVNVCPAERPSDAYKAVAIEAKKYLPKRMHSWMDRKTCKRTVMTIPYNATKDSSRKYIKEALKEKGINPEPGELTQVVNAVYQSMDAIVPGPMRVMRWIKQHVGEYIKNGAELVEWTTPSGFVVVQQRDKHEVQRIELQLLGRTRVNLATGEHQPCPKKHRSSTAPNFIHSLDASLLHCSFQQFDEPFTVIHDSVLTRAGDMGTLNRLVRETYTDIFTQACWLTRFGETIQASEPPPIVGTLDTNVVTNSTYFFC